MGFPPRYLPIVAAIVAIMLSSRPVESRPNVCFLPGGSIPLKGLQRTEILNGIGGRAQCSFHERKAGGRRAVLQVAPGKIGQVTQREPLKFELLNEDGLARRGKLHFRRGNWTVSANPFIFKSLFHPAMLSVLGALQRL